MRKMKPLAENVHIAEDGTAIEIVDQTRLPGEYVLKKVGTAEEMYDAIKSLAVRGAPAIGIFAGYCMYALAEQIAAELVAAGGKDASATAGAAASAEENPAVREMLSALSEKAAYLKSSRPTAVNLAWATERMLDKARETAAQLAALKDGGAADAGAAGGNAGDGTRAENTPAVMRIAESLGDEAILIQQEDIEMCRRISEYGLSLLRDGDTVLTHCNAGPLATSRYGTAIGPLILAKERGMDIRAYADETRPLLQGARLTAYELQKAGVDVTLICDNMASLVMKSGKISACFVGCDRVAANGDTANKIGTSGVAILAKHYGIPFYVLGPTSSIDLACRTGADIPIELRDGEEIRSMYYEKPMAPAGVACFNPSFDVTDYELIAGIVTEKGIVRSPYTENLAALF